MMNYRPNEDEGHEGVGFCLCLFIWWLLTYSDGYLVCIPPGSYLPPLELY